MEMDIDHLRQWIGREETRSELLTPALVERFNATFNHSDTVEKGDAAPSLIHFCLTQVAVPCSGLGTDGHPSRGGFLPPVPLPRRMWAGGKVNFIDELHVGELITRHSRIADVVVKEGRTGLLCFVAVEHVIKSGGREAIRERQDIVYRDFDTAGSRKVGASHPTPHGDHHKLMNAPTPLLFRYSALTFNSHRIHYDLPYAKEEEGYSGLVVHGPLQATLLLRLAEQVRGERVKKFSYRGVAPLINISDFSLNGSEDENGMKLWTSSEGGVVTMEAHAAW